MKTPTTEFTYNGNKFKHLVRYCNKKNCKCHNGQPHGPYWYQLKNNTNQLTYIGKTIPNHILVHLAQLAAGQEKIKKEITKLNILIRILENKLDNAEELKRELEILSRSGNANMEKLKPLKLNIFKSLL